jgi:hypothetical protein
MRIAEKKEGIDMPKTPKNRAHLSTQVSLNIAANMPINIPNTIAIKIEVIANTMVLGKVSEMIRLTDLPDFLKEVLR